MPPISPPLPRNRHRALSELEVQILKAEQERNAWQQKAASLAIACGDKGVAKAAGLAAARADQRVTTSRLRMAEERLARLQASREVLISGVRPEADVDE